MFAHSSANASPMYLCVMKGSHVVFGGWRGGVDFVPLAVILQFRYFFLIS